jgi:predicted regulator of Ras-like GTPase activity (Roadblock/LC7/MglB family)
MHTILQALRDLEGVHGAFVSDGTGEVVAYNAESIYDASLLDRASHAIANAIDSVKLLQEDWENIVVQFSEGRLLIRSIPAPSRGKAAVLVLSLVADPRLNAAFATVAIRVAIGKIRALLDANGGVLPGVTRASPQASARDVAAGVTMPHGAVAVNVAPPMNSPSLAASAPPTAAASSPEVAGSGLSWSGLGSASTMSASGVSVVDAASSAALTACTKCLARAVGPMAKVFVKDAVRKIAPDQPFSKSMLAALIAELEKGIDDPSDSSAFRKAALKLI